jgi:hypothetical protein
MLFKRFCLLILCVVVLSATGMTSAQTRPAVEYRSLLNMTFDESSGDFQIDALHIIFPPAGYEQATLTINKASGEEVATLQLRFDSYVNFPVFGRFVPESKPAKIQLRASGDFVLAIKIANEVITRFPFTVFGQPNSDAYAAPKKFWRDGPWRDFGYFSLPVNQAAGAVRFNWWMSTRELPEGLSDPSISLRLFENNKEIARGVDNFRLSSLDWQFFTTELVNTRSRNRQQLMVSDLVARDATYLLIVEADGAPIKSYRVDVNNRRLQRVDQSRIDFEPHADFIAPRFIESKAETGGDASVTDAIWVRRSGVRGLFPPTAKQTSNEVGPPISRNK